MLWRPIGSMAVVIAMAIVACLYVPVHAIDDFLSRAQKDGIRVAFFYGRNPMRF